MGDGPGAVLSWRLVEREGRGAQRDRTWTQRRLVRLQLRLRDGRCVESEAAPLPGHSRETAEDVGAWLQRWGDGWPPPASRLPSLDFALSDLALQVEGRAAAAEVRVNGLLDDPLRQRDLGPLLAQGIDTVKVKVGRRGQAEAERAVVSSLSASGLRVRADANQGMGPDFDPEAWATLGLDLFEEPAPWPRAQAWTEQLPLAWDESVRALDPRALEATPRPRAVVVKPTLLGGFEQVEAWARAASRAGLRFVLTHAYESEVGLRSLVRWARLLGTDGERHGLLPHRFCEPEAFSVEGGVLREAT